MRVLSLTTLYPHAGAPHHGVFVENRLAALAARGHEIRVVAPVPWFPSASPRFGRYAQHAGAARTETRRGIAISHPRFLLPPKLGMNAAPMRLAAAFRRGVEAAMVDGFRPDLIDAHYYYPDAVAAAAVARERDLPLVATARGTDVNLIPAHAPQRRAILAAAAQAEHTITVASALRDELIRLGADGGKITTIRNGVDLERFSPGDRKAARAALGVAGSGPVLASVGHLTERKGHHLVLDMLAGLPDARLLIAGSGEEDRALRRQAEALGLTERVRFLGAVPHDDLAKVYRAADVLVLASSREGWPNVLLEAMACGCACVATPVWGSGEVVADPAAGRLAADRSAPALLDAARRLLAAPPPRGATRRYAERFGWEPVAAAVEEVWDRAARRSAWGAPFPPRPARGGEAAPTPALAPTPAPAPAYGAAGLLLTVDTEECFDWQDGGAWSVPAPDGILALQAIAERHRVKPLYLASYPMITDDRMGGVLADLVRAGRAEAGIHLHSWSTPPGGGESAGPTSYQHNLPPEMRQAKLDALIAAFASRFGAPPIAHRAGRYGASPAVLDELAARGILLESSPSAAFDCTKDGGPDYASLDSRPRRRGGMLVLPASGARRWRRGRFGAPPPGLASGAALASSALAWPVRLSPEGNGADTMIALARHLLTCGVPTLVPSLHSSTLTPGSTRYARSPDEVQAVLGRLDAFLGRVIAEGCRPMDVASVLADHAQGTAQAAE